MKEPCPTLPQSHTDFALWVVFVAHTDLTFWVFLGLTQISLYGCFRLTQISDFTDFLLWVENLTENGRVGCVLSDYSECSECSDLSRLTQIQRDSTR